MHSSSIDTTRVLDIIEQVQSLGTIEARQTLQAIIDEVESAASLRSDLTIVTADPSASVGGRIGLAMALAKYNDIVSDEQSSLLNEAKRLIDNHSHDDKLSNYYRDEITASVQPIPDDVYSLTIPTTLDEACVLIGIVHSLYEVNDGDRSVHVIGLAREGLCDIEAPRTTLRNFYAAATKAYYALAMRQPENARASLEESLRNVNLAIEFEDDGGRPRSSLFNRKSRLLYDLGRFDEALPAALEALQFADGDEKTRRSSTVSRIAAKLTDQRQLADSAVSFLQSYVDGMLWHTTQLDRLAYCHERRGQVQFAVISLCEGGLPQLAFQLWEAAKAVEIRLSVSDPRSHGVRRELLREATAQDRERRTRQLLGDKDSKNLNLSKLEQAYDEVQELIGVIVRELIDNPLQLPKGVLYISYCLQNDNAGWLFTLDRSDLTSERLSFGAHESRQSMKPPIDEVLTNSVKNRIEDAWQVIVSPDDGLWQFRFLHALPALQEREFSLIESLCTLASSNNREPSLGLDSASDRDINVIVAGSSYAETTKPLWLSSVALRQVSTHYGQETMAIASDQTFDKQALQHLVARGPKLLHVVGHALFSNPRDSGSIARSVLNSGIQVRSDSGQAELLTALDFEEIAVPIDLVTLSCCESGLGVPFTEGLAGLPLGLRCVGTRALVGTLVPTSEIGSLFVMSKLHQYLASGERVGSAMLRLRGWSKGLSNADLEQMSEWLNDQPEITQWLATNQDNSTAPSHLKFAIENVERALILLGDPNVQAVVA